MADRKNKTPSKPRIELEELYQGIPDESVNLTFQDLADLNQKTNASEMKIHTITTFQPVSHVTSPKKPTSSPSPLAKIPSLEFSTGLQASSHHLDNYQGHGGGGGLPWGHFGHDQHNDHGNGHFSHASGAQSPVCKPGHAGGDGHHSGYSMGYDDVSGMSAASGAGYPERSGRRRRPGIPHSKICTICSTYVYLFRTRCLVCGRAYCRQCLYMGMGDMTEGRKCIECLGLRFSQRYIERAGKVGCCNWRYPSTVKQAEIKWAEKGPRRSGERGYGGRSGMVSSRSRSPMTPRSHAANNEPSFVMSASYSPYSPHSHHHHLPL